MKSQKEIFSEKEADAWFERNHRALANFDPETDAIILQLRPHLAPNLSVAEVGCALAGRTDALDKMTGGRGYGVDPSAQALAEAARLRNAAANARQHKSADQYICLRAEQEERIGLVGTLILGVAPHALTKRCVA
jgi:hypothetical protein